MIRAGPMKVVKIVIVQWSSDKSIVKDKAAARSSQEITCNMKTAIKQMETRGYAVLRI